MSHSICLSTLGLGWLFLLCCFYHPPPPALPAAQPATVLDASRRLLSGVNAIGAGGLFPGKGADTSPGEGYAFCPALGIKAHVASRGGCAAHRMVGIAHGARRCKPWGFSSLAPLQITVATRPQAVAAAGLFCQFKAPLVRFIVLCGCFVHPPSQPMPQRPRRRFFLVAKPCRHGIKVCKGGGCHPCAAQ